MDYFRFLRKCYVVLFGVSDIENLLAAFYTIKQGCFLLYHTTLSKNTVQKLACNGRKRIGNPLKTETADIVFS